MLSCFLRDIHSQYNKDREKKYFINIVVEISYSNISYNTQVILHVTFFHIQVDLKKKHIDQLNLTVHISSEECKHFSNENMNIMQNNEGYWFWQSMLQYLFVIFLSSSSNFSILDLNNVNIWSESWVKVE